MSEQFRYEPLHEEGTVRLLFIHPGDKNDDLEGELRHVPLHAAGPFEALSYTWGTQSIEQAISVAGKRISITSNCASAIRNLRRQYGYRTVWIDAICINQNDNEEKADQVGMMGEIYARAERTLVYLGPGDGTVHILRNRAQINPGASVGSRKGQHDQIEDAKARLLARDWFHRKWIIQEVLLSRDIIVQAGPHEFTWAELETLDIRKEVEVIQLAKRYLHPCSLSSNQAPSGQDWDPKAKAAWEEMFEQGEVVSMAKQRESTANLQRANKYRSPHTGFLMALQLFDVLCTTSDFGCKEPRDRVFSIMSLFATKPGISLDYTCDEQEIYDTLTRELIALGDSRLLWLEDRTTWRPRWKTALSTLSTFVRDKGRASGKNTSATDIGRLWKEVQLERRIGINSSPSKIIWTTQGVCLGRISNISSKPFEHHHVQSRAMSIGDPHHDHWTSILKTLALKPSLHEAGSHPISHIHHRNRQNLPWYHSWTLDLVSRPDSMEIDDVKTLKRASTHHHGHISFCKGMHMFLSDTGIIAAAPPGIRHGDVVYFLPGHSCPFVVLREKNEQWEMLGLTWLGPLKLIPACFTSRGNVFEKERWETLKIV